jgi:hypothetical protein
MILTAIQYRICETPGQKAIASNNEHYRFPKDITGDKIMQGALPLTRGRLLIRDPCPLSLSNHQQHQDNCAWSQFPIGTY